jgi:hypothetical protein
MHSTVEDLQSAAPEHRRQRFAAVLSKEWIYTKRDWKGVVASALIPLLIVTLQFVPGALGGRIDKTVAPIFAFFALYIAVTFATVLRTVDRARDEVRRSVGVMYLLLGVSPASMVGAKVLFELAVNTLIVLPVTLILFVHPSLGLSGAGILHILSATVSLSLLGMFISIAIRSEAARNYARIFLIMTPLVVAPGLAQAFGVKIDALLWIPSMAANQGFNTIAESGTADLFLSAILIAEAVVYAAFLPSALEGMLRRELTRTDQ